MSEENNKQEISKEEVLRLKREELKRKLSKRYLVNLYPKTESQYSAPIEFVKEVNLFQHYIERFFYNGEIFGEDGEKFPIESYMRIYDMIQLNAGFLLKCAYTRDGLGGRMNILASQQEIELKVLKQNLLTEYSNTSLSRSYDLMWEQFDILQRYYDSLSAKKNIYTFFSEMGCLQYLHFYEFAEAFAFEWHSAPCRKYVLTSVSDLKEIANNLKKCEGRFAYRSETLEDLVKMLNRDEFFCPIFYFSENHCTIEWIEFHTHSGVYRCKYEIGKRMLTRQHLDKISVEAISDGVKQIEKESLLSIHPMFRY